MGDRDVVTSGLKRARALARRPGLAAICAAAIAAGALASAPAALAQGANYQWTGGDPNVPDWGQTDNWAGGAAPSGTIGTLSFPDLGGTCDDGSSTNTCYASNDQLGGLTADQLTIDDDQAYSIGADNSSALTLDGGLSAAPDGAAPDFLTGDPTLGIPITLGADQTWAIDGGAAGNDGIAVPQISGAQKLNVVFTNGGSLSTTAITSTAIVASGNGALMVQPGGDFGSGGVAVTGNAELDVEGVMSPGPSEGSLTVSGTQAAQPTLTVEAGSDPDAQLVASNVSLDSSTNLYLELDDDADALDSSGNPQGFSQLAGANVNLGGATLGLDQGWSDPFSDCVTLTPGDSFPIITASGMLSGDLKYVDGSKKLDTLAPGQTSRQLPVSLPDQCSFGAPATAALATLTYRARTITATVVSASAGSSGTGGGGKGGGGKGGGSGGGGSNGGNSPAPATGRTGTEIKAALGKIGHPSGSREIREFTKSGVFKVRFAAPTAGELSIAWTARVVTDAGKHRKRRTVTVATGSGHAGGKGAIDVTVHLTSAGRALLKQKPHGLAITATDRFKPKGYGWTTVTRHFSL